MYVTVNVYIYIYMSDVIYIYMTECRKKMRTEKQKGTQRLEGNRPATSSKVFCFKCRAEFRKKYSTKLEKKEKRKQNGKNTELEKTKNT